MNCSCDKIEVIIWKKIVYEIVSSGKNDWIEVIDAID